MPLYYGWYGTLSIYLIWISEMKERVALETWQLALSQNTATFFFRDNRFSFNRNYLTSSALKYCRGLIVYIILPYLLIAASTQDLLWWWETSGISTFHFWRLQAYLIFSWPLKHDSSSYHISTLLLIIVFSSSLSFRVIDLKTSASYFFGFIGFFLVIFLFIL